MDSIAFMSVDRLQLDYLSWYEYDRPASLNIDSFAENASVFEYT